MLFLTRQQCEEWCRQRFVDFNPYDKKSLDIMSMYHARFALPRDCGRVAGLSRDLKTMIGFSNDILLWAVHWGIFDGCENVDLFNRYRMSYGENRPLKEVSGQLIGKKESTALASLTHLCMISFWDCWLIDAELPMFVSFDHDDQFEVWTSSKELFNTAVENLSDFELQRWSKKGSKQGDAAH